MKSLPHMLWGCRMYPEWWVLRLFGLKGGFERAKEPIGFDVSRANFLN